MSDSKFNTSSFYDSNFNNFIIREFIEFIDFKNISEVKKLLDDFNDDDILKINEVVDFYFRQGFNAGIEFFLYLKN